LNFTGYTCSSNDLLALSEKNSVVKLTEFSIDAIEKVKYRI